MAGSVTKSMDERRFSYPSVGGLRSAKYELQRIVAPPWTGSGRPLLPVPCACGSRSGTESLIDCGDWQIRVETNDILRSVRYLLDLSDLAVVETIRLADPASTVGRDEVRAWLLREDEAAWVRCPDADLARFLDGLIVRLRGPRRDEHPPPTPSRISNNDVLKKLRIAFKLTDVDLHALLAATGVPMAKAELTALFRQPGHRHFRHCGDQILRNVLRGLTGRLCGAPGISR